MTGLNIQTKKKMKLIINQKLGKLENLQQKIKSKISKTNNYSLNLSKAKKFANLKDYLGDDSAKKSHGPHTSKYKKKQGGTFYSEKNDQNNRVDKDGLSKPVFTSSIKRENVQNIVSDEAYGSIRNTNTEYTKKSNYNTYNTERKQFFNSKPVERSDNFNNLNNFNTANPVKKPM